MKHFVVFFLFLHFSLTASTQLKKEEIKIGKLLPNEAFDKMITQDISYAIFGETSPVSGIKLDVSKPEATISGVFQSKKNEAILGGFEFKGGITDKNFSIFKGLNSFNTAFELKPFVHIIPRWNSGKYYKYNEPILTAKNQLIQNAWDNLADSLNAVTLIYNKHLEDFTDLLDISQTLPTEGTITKSQKNIFLYFLNETLKADGVSIDPNASLRQLLHLIPTADPIDMPKTYRDNIIETYKKYKKLFGNGTDGRIAKQIANVSAAWTKKKYWWLTISPFARTEKITAYHTKYNGADSLYFKPNYPFYYGLNVTLNTYILWTNKVALFARAGVGMSRANNLSSLSSFNYETISPFFSNGVAVTTKNESGTAYNNDEIKSNFATQVFAEVYLLPLKSFIPGVYFSGSINHSALYNLSNVVDREKDKVLIPLEGGLVFNVNSREKDKEKSILSISAYVRYEDVTDKKRTSKALSEEESKDDFIKRNLSFGLKVGIPITLPQRNN